MLTLTFWWSFSPISQPWHGDDKEGSALYKYRVSLCKFLVPMWRFTDHRCDGLVQYAGKGGKIETHMPATSHETVGCHSAN